MCAHVCARMCGYVRVHVRMDRCACAGVLACMPVRKFAFIDDHVYVYSYKCARVCRRMCVCGFVGVLVILDICVCMYMTVYVCAHACACLHLCTYIYMCIHVQILCLCTYFHLRMLNVCSCEYVLVVCVCVYARR